MRTLQNKEIENLKKQLKQKQDKYGITKLRTAIYARKSQEDEKQTSLDTQIKVCTAFIQQYKDLLELKNVFQEDDRSGMFADNRDQYQLMLTQAERGEIDVIVVMKLDRLARDLCESTTVIKLLNMYKCTLLAGDDVSDSDTPSGEFMRNILLAQNQYHARRVASDVIHTDCNLAKQGKTVGGVAPYRTQNR